MFTSSKPAIPSRLDRSIRSWPRAKSVIVSSPWFGVNTKVSAPAPPVRTSSPLAADQQVVLGAAVERVVPLAAEEPVVTPFAEEVVVSFLAVEIVGLCAAEYLVIALTAQDAVVSAHALDGVVFLAVEHEGGIIRSHERINRAV